MMKCSTPGSPSTISHHGVRRGSHSSQLSWWKTALVAVLAMILAWRPALAAMLGKIFIRAWPGMREA
jgi:hypothetical protein